MKTLSVLIGILVFVVCQSATSSQFAIETPPLNVESPLFPILGLPTLYLSAHDVVWDHVRQGLDPKYPGDYYIAPSGAPRDILSATDIAGIRAALHSIIDSNLCDDYILSNISGYRYTLKSDNIERREFYVRYSKSDTIYVISGWLGKFLSFYRAIPGYFRLGIPELQKEIEKMSPQYISGNEEEFHKVLEKGAYFYEFVNKKSMTRVRNYHVREIYLPTGESNGDTTTEKIYHLIEITKFLDKEMIP